MCTWSFSNICFSRRCYFDELEAFPVIFISIVYTAALFRKITKNTFRKIKHWFYYRSYMSRHKKNNAGMSQWEYLKTHSTYSLSYNVCWANKVPKLDTVKYFISIREQIKRILKSKISNCWKADVFPFFKKYFCCVFSKHFPYMCGKRIKKD